MNKHSVQNRKYVIKNTNVIPQFKKNQICIDIFITSFASCIVFIPLPHKLKCSILFYRTAKPKNRPSFRQIHMHLDIAAADFLSTPQEAYFDKQVGHSVVRNFVVVVILMYAMRMNPN